MNYLDDDLDLRLFLDFFELECLSRPLPLCDGDLDFRRYGDFDLRWEVEGDLDLLGERDLDKKMSNQVNKIFLASKFIIWILLVHSYQPIICLCTYLSGFSPKFRGTCTCKILGYDFKIRILKGEGPLKNSIYFYKSVPKTGYSNNLSSYH